MKDLKLNLYVEELPQDYCGIVPFLVDLEGDSMNVEVYEGLEDAAIEYIKKYENAPFSKSAFDFICTAVDEYLKDKPYSRDEYGRTRFYRKFMITDKSSLDPGLIKASSVKMEGSMNSLENLTSLFSDDTKEVPPLSFVTVENGSIVSVATVNDTDSDSILELTVNTAPAFRGQGFAASNVTSLAGYLLDGGYKVAYSASNYNKASIKIAKKCGFEQIGRFYAVSAYKLN